MALRHVVHVLDHLTIEDNGQFRVLISLAEWAHKQTGVVPPYPIEELRQRAQMSKASIYRKLAELEADGLIEWEGQRDRRGWKVPPTIRLKFATMDEESKSQIETRGRRPSLKSAEPSLKNGQPSLTVETTYKDQESTKTQPSKRDSSATLFDEPQPAQPKPSATFDQFWAIYPKKRAKGAARKAWDKAVAKTDPAKILSAAVAYAKSRAAADPKFTKWPQGWLADERWDDQPDLPSADRPIGVRVVTDGII
jgi:hypothetical protein